MMSFLATGRPSLQEFASQNTVIPLGKGSEERYNGGEEKPAASVDEPLLESGERCCAGV